MMDYLICNRIQAHPLQSRMGRLGMAFLPRNETNSGNEETTKKAVSTACSVCFAQIFLTVEISLVTLRTPISEVSVSSWRNQRSFCCLLRCPGGFAEYCCLQVRLYGA